MLHRQSMLIIEASVNTYIQNVIIKLAKLITNNKMKEGEEIWTHLYLFFFACVTLFF